MGSRIILPYGETGEYIQKAIPKDELLQNFKFPSLDAYMNDKSTLEEPIFIDEEQEFVLPVWSAIEQQYNEWYNWYSAPEEIRNFLAPIVGSSYNEYHLPVLYFPRFMPIMDEIMVDSLIENDALIIAGMRMERFNIKEIDVIHFFQDLRKVCDYLELNEEDIYNNPSNIGYNPTFGLRIIDYGLSNT